MLRNAVYYLCAAVAVRVEEKGGMGVWFWERGERDAFLVPFYVCWVVGVVGWFEELGEDGILSLRLSC